MNKNTDAATAGIYSYHCKVNGSVSEELEYTAPSISNHQAMANYSLKSVHSSNRCEKYVISTLTMVPDIIDPTE